MKRIHYPVSGKVCFDYITRSEKRKARADKKLFEFLMYFYARNESLAKKAMARIKGRGLGTLETITIADEFDEWWKGQWKYVNENGLWVAKRQKKGEKHRRAGKNSKKAVRSKAEKRHTRDDAAVAAYIKNCIKGNSSLGFS
jgi:hypothetical protein